MIPAHLIFIKSADEVAWILTPATQLQPQQESNTTITWLVQQQCLDTEHVRSCMHCTVLRRGCDEARESLPARRVLCSLQSEAQRPQHSPSPPLTTSYPAPENKSPKPSPPSTSSSYCQTPNSTPAPRKRNPKPDSPSPSSSYSRGPHWARPSQGPHPYSCSSPADPTPTAARHTRTGGTRDTWP